MSVPEDSAAWAEAEPRSGHADKYRVPKIPAFFRAEPELWFAQVEATFRTARIASENTKADTVLAVLNYDVIALIKDLIIADPRPTDIFSTLKRRVIAMFGES